jgi:hypothetical protein
MTRSSNRKTVLAAASVLLLIGGCCLCPKKTQPPRIRPAVSTKHAEVDMGHQHSAQFLGAANKPIAPCEQDWFRNLLGTTAFGHALACPVDPSTIGLTSVDYSLQIQRGLGAVFGQSPSANPCFNVSPPTPPPPGPRRRRFSCRSARWVRRSSPSAWPRRPKRRSS